MKKDDKMKTVVDRLTAMIEKEPTQEDQRKHIKRMIDVFISEFDEEEKIEITQAIFHQLSYKRLVEEPKRLLEISNMKIRTYFFNWIFASVFLLILGLLFSDNPFITRLNESLVVISKVLGF